MYGHPDYINLVEYTIEKKIVKIIQEEPKLPPKIETPKSISNQSEPEDIKELVKEEVKEEIEEDPRLIESEEDENFLAVNQYDDAKDAESMGKVERRDSLKSSKSAHSAKSQRLLGEDSNLFVKKEDI